MIYKIATYAMAALLIVLGSCCMGVAIVGDHTWYHGLVLFVIGGNVILMGLVFPRAVGHRGDGHD